MLMRKFSMTHESQSKFYEFMLNQNLFVQIALDM